jgi:S-(hydroxymethyl)glutathione dehydrogenase/alcohol dehydrogenase
LEFGVTETIINDNNEQVKNKIHKIFGEKGPEVVFETTGNSKLMENAYEMTPNNGKTVFVGVPNDKISIYSLPLAFDKKIEVSHGGDSIPDKEIPRYINLSRDKGIDFSKFITHEFNLDDINEALKLFRSGKAGRIILKINE